MSTVNGAIRGLTLNILRGVEYLFD